MEDNMTPDQDNYDANRLLFRATLSGDRRLVEEALASGADPNASGPGRETPLHWAAEKGWLDITKLLIQKGANPNARNQHRHTPLHLASQQGDSRLVQFLMASGAQANVKDNRGDSPTDLARRRGHENVVTMLQDAETKDSHADRAARHPYTDTPIHDELSRRPSHSDIRPLLDKEGFADRIRAERQDSDEPERGGR
jgi:ankyrin repeat protein